ncbi:MAG: ImmA/IrrE family metallo-endopeptidase [Sedimentisphaerales bacterium]|nr:ImmA/IrrE family metallo-endopeptidase [Sedimentisphaerales bacterium]
MITKKELARKAYTSAIKERRRARIGPDSPICVFDFVYQFNVEVRFQNIPSMEGLYYNDGNPLILISSCRPRGRMAFSCAHEYGHHIFDHGSRVDEVLDSVLKKQWEPDEFLANCFAGFLLMPKLAVSKAFTARGWKISECTPGQAFAVSGYLGVGYQSLLTHMHSSLKIISSSHFEQLNNLTPKMLKSKLAGFEHTREAILLDKYWGEHPVDICVGDILIVPTHTVIEQTCMQLVKAETNRSIYRAVSQGIDKAQNEVEKWASHIRVSRVHYEGLVQYRHFPEIDND